MLGDIDNEKGQSFEEWSHSEYLHFLAVRAELAKALLKVIFK